MTTKTKAAKAEVGTKASAEDHVKEKRKPCRSNARRKEMERMGLDPRPYGLKGD